MKVAEVSKISGIKEATVPCEQGINFSLAWFLALFKRQIFKSFYNPLEKNTIIAIHREIYEVALKLTTEQYLSGGYSAYPIF